MKRRWKKRNDGKFKFPIDSLDKKESLDFDGCDTFTSNEIKKKISSEVFEIESDKKNKRKCKTKKLM